MWWAQLQRSVWPCGDVVRGVGREHSAQVPLPEKSARTRLAHYDTAIEGILRGEFPPKPNDRLCPRCPYYFICPAGVDPS